MTYPSPTPFEYVSGVGANYDLLSDPFSGVVVNYKLESITNADFAIDAGPSAPGTSAGQAEYPAGALLAHEATAVGGGRMLARSADDTTVDLPTNVPVMSVYTAGALANRGAAGNQTIPAKDPTLVGVLALDYDMTGQTSDQVIAVFWEGTFKPRAIQIDAEAAAAGSPWPSAAGVCDRIRISPVLHGVY